MSLPWELIAAVAAGLALLYFAGRVLIVPMGPLWRVCCRGVLGGMGLLALNLSGAPMGWHLPLNPCTALLAGWLGLPGVALIHTICRLSA